MKNKDFCHLHVHNEYSLLDGYGDAKQYISRVKEMETSIQPNLLIEIIDKLQDATITDNTIIFRGDTFDHLILLAGDERFHIRIS